MQYFWDLDEKHQRDPWLYFKGIDQNLKTNAFRGKLFSRNATGGHDNYDDQETTPAADQRGEQRDSKHQWKTICFPVNHALSWRRPAHLERKQVSNGHTQ
jgi:hypothetical protein